MGEVFGVAGMAEASLVKHLLGDRRGDDRRGAAGKDVADGAVDGFDDAGGVAGVRPCRDCRGSRASAARPAASGRMPTRHRPASPRRSAAPAPIIRARARDQRRIADDVEGRACPRRARDSHALMAISGPTPDGSPAVSASGGTADPACTCNGSALDDARLFPELGDVFLAELVALLVGRCLRSRTPFARRGRRTLRGSSRCR